jgi:DNA polymerase-4
MVKLLNPLSIKKIPMVGDVTFQLLSRIGIRTIQTLSEMPAEVLQQMIGKNGIDIWKKQMVLTTIQ